MMAASSRYSNGTKSMAVPCLSVTRSRLVHCRRTFTDIFSIRQEQPVGIFRQGLFGALGGAVGAAVHRNLRVLDVAC